MVLRALPLWSDRLGLVGRADAVEFHADGAIVPVEYKIGQRHEDAAHLQLCGQAICLKEMLGRLVRWGLLWFSGPRRRVPVAIDDDLRGRTEATIQEIWTWLAAERLPPPVDDVRCRSCQLLDLCQPRLSARPEDVWRYMAEVVGCGS